MRVGLFLLLIRIDLLVGGLPHWGYSREWYHRPSRGPGFLLVIVLLGRI
jgi:hypothetical protein